MDSKSGMAYRHSTQDVLNWFRDQVAQSGQKAHIHDHLVREDGDYLYLPVHVPDKDAFGVARYLQEIEDKWNDQEPEPYPRLLLVPTKD